MSSKNKSYSFLNQINADNFLTLKDENDYKMYEYLFKSRTNASISNIVVINHSLLIQDVSSTTPIF